MSFRKLVVIDGKDHLKGRLASYVAKQIMNGQNVVVVRCEAVNVSGSLYRNKLKYKDFKRKRTLYNPKKGPLHGRFPSYVIWRTVRGMVPHKTPRGANAMGTPSHPPNP
jgi:large subunit ribosomal protein L13Ae